MSFRWRRFLPRFPAVLLIPGILGSWFVSGFQYASAYDCVFRWHFPLYAYLFYRSPQGWFIPLRGSFVVDVATFLATGLAAPAETLRPASLTRSFQPRASRLTPRPLLQYPLRHPAPPSAGGPP